jgi:glycosyltransferase involved in cell wall biosynthesis
MPFIDPNFNKDHFGVEGKMVLLTFGLLSPNKGIEHFIEALPAILEQHHLFEHYALSLCYIHRFIWQFITTLFLAAHPT